ncbi:MAG TPA: tyrosine--tRNA ligase [archaeon]|nr:tyrosine--tRNA ligase [archaeon]
MDLEKRIELISKAPTEEVITPEDLRKLLESKTKVSAYDGFEPSGILHLGSGILKAIKIQDMLDAKVNFILYVADWFAIINNKFGGDLDKIQIAGKYFVEGWKACGIDMKKVKIMWTSDVVKDPEYWNGVIQVAKHITIPRAIRAGTIMGREERDMQQVAQLLYPMMQAYDPFYLEADILQLGMDQRKATILTKEIAPKIDGSIRVPVHHHLILGLQGGARAGKETEADLKMSKSVPKSSIYIHDDAATIEDKIKSAYCPEKIVENNPILDFWKHIIFRKFDSRNVKRPAKFGGNLEIQSYDELEKIFREGKLHPLDLKKETSAALNEILGPIRKHFEKGSAKKLYDDVKSFQITR